MLLLCHLSICFYLCCYGDGWEPGLLNDFWIKGALSDLFLNDPDFMAFSHIYAEKDYAKPFKAVFQHK